MSASTHAKKAADDDAESKPLSKDDMYSMLNSLKNEVMSLKSARSSDAAENRLRHARHAGQKWIWHSPTKQHTDSLPMSHVCHVQEARNQGLLAQSVCHAPVTLDQLVTTAILAKREEKPNSTFVGQVILNASTKTNEDNRQLSPFVYRIADLPANPTHSHRPHSLGPSHPWHQTTDIRHWRTDCPNTKGVANPNPHQPRERPPLASGSRYQHERVSQVQFVEHHAADKVLIGSSASIHLSGSAKFATDLHAIHPFRIFFADSNSSITITQMATLKILVRGGLVIISNIAFSNKVLGTILSVGRLCRACVFPLFSGLMLSLVVCNHLITTTFHNNCWWMNVKVSG
ncbi:hypothetical protein O181_085274 [Austropuccinia psidii MF-1]|uniref:Uncharacterized protein n=1 Tax=Austropuccinia psidii MF-1 TaxID=1389203 RepID=A0A9Q3IMX3_9BASI|nr:hypothetical protein [Austropuccinia psidii MF-1]